MDDRHLACRPPRPDLVVLERVLRRAQPREPWTPHAPYPNADRSEDTRAPALDAHTNLPHHMPPTVRLHTLYIQNASNAPHTHLQDAIEAVCAWQPQTVEDLGSLLLRAPASLRPALKDLTASNRLRATGTPPVYHAVQKTLDPETKGVVRYDDE